MLNIEKFLIRSKEFYIKTMNKFRINYIEEISIKSDAKKMKGIKCQKLLLLYIIVSFRPILWCKSQYDLRYFNKLSCNND